MITLLTDFGQSDYFVPAVKGRILSINPAARIIDLTHEITPQDIRAAAFTLGACYADFPEGTIHVAVVDPGVGSERAAIIVETPHYRFVGPDNGIFSFIYSREPGSRAYLIANPKYQRRTRSETFHGRDVFAPAAAHLSLGVPASEMGGRMAQPVAFDVPAPKPAGDARMIEGAILHIDRFGNIITNFTEGELSSDEASARVFLIGGHTVSRFGSHFAAAGHELIAYPGSAGYWEIALRCDSAADRLGVRPGDPVHLRLAD